MWWEIFEIWIYYFSHCIISIKLSQELCQQNIKIIIIIQLLSSLACTAVLTVMNDWEVSCKNIFCKIQYQTWLGFNDDTFSNSLSLYWKLFLKILVKRYLWWCGDSLIKPKFFLIFKKINLIRKNSFYYSTKDTLHRNNMLHQWGWESKSSSSF